VTVIRGVTTRECCRGDAALISDVHSVWLGVPDSCAKVRESCASWCADRRGMCALRCFAWMTNRLSAVVVAEHCCAADPRRWRAHPLRSVCCGMLSNRSHGVMQASETHFEIRAVQPDCTAVRALVCDDPHRHTRLSIPAAGRMCSSCAGFSNYGGVVVATEFVTLRRCMSDGCADRAQIALQMRQCDLRIVRET
jgi:hypothetical protein